MYCFYLKTCCNLDCVLFLKIRVMDLWAVFGWTGGGLCALYVLLPFLVRFYPWIAHRIVFLHFGKPYPFSFSLSHLSPSLSLSEFSNYLSVSEENFSHFWVNSSHEWCVIWHISVEHPKVVFKDLKKPESFGLKNTRNFYLDVDDESTIGVW